MTDLATNILETGRLERRIGDIACQVYDYDGRTRARLVFYWPEGGKRYDATLFAGETHSLIDAMHEAARMLEGR